MLDTLRMNPLPGAKPRAYSMTDITSFRSVWESAAGIVSSCLNREAPEVGWTHIGESLDNLQGLRIKVALNAGGIGTFDSIGILILTRDSPQDTLISAGPRSAQEALHSASPLSSVHVREPSA